MNYPHHIGRYNIDGLLGKGGLGTVYRATDPKLNRQVALKVLNVAVDKPDIRQRFQMEARTIATLKHPNIVQLYDYSDGEADKLYLVMEYIPGPSLQHLITNRGTMSEQTALCIAHEVAQALNYAHQRQLIHRDVKPGNVILHQGQVILLDFGSIKIIGNNNALGVEQVNSSTQVIGTPGFMAPEQFVGKKLDARTDVFALGALLYNLVTDAYPFHGSDLLDIEELYVETKHGRYRDPRNYQPMLSQAFCALLADCLEPSPSDRISDMPGVIKRIEQLLQMHHITDIKAELCAYEAAPEKSTLQQQSRSADAIYRELKVALLQNLQLALRSRNTTQAKQAMAKLQHIAPLEALIEGGINVKSQQVPTLAQRRRRRRWFLYGVLCGAVLAALAHFLPPLLKGYLF